MKRRKRFPIPGQRIIRSIIAVWLCFAVYLLRGRNGLPIFSAIAVLHGIQPYTRDMKTIARRRILGTLIGAFWGLLLLLLEQLLIREGLPDEPLHYLLASVTAGVVIYSTVLLHVTDMSFFAAVVFLSVAIYPVGGGNPYLYTVNRLLDTGIGIAIAELVNRLQLPRRKNTDTLYISAIGHAILNSDNRLSPYSKVELNRLIEDGAKITVSTVHSQATVRELLGGVRLPYPIITMDGAAIYNMESMEYLRTDPIPEERVERFLTWADGEGLPYFVNCIEDNLLVVRYRALANEGMRRQLETKRLSPYRNYVRTEEPVRRNVVYLMLLDTDERIEAAWPRLMQEPWIGEYRVVKDRSRFEGFSFLKVYNAETSRRAMLGELEKLMGTKKTVTLGGDPEQYDVYIADSDRDAVVKEIRRRFEPVDLRCWRSIFRL